MLRFVIEHITVYSISKALKIGYPLAIILLRSIVTFIRPKLPFRAYTKSTNRKT